MKGTIAISPFASDFGAQLELDVSAERTVADDDALRHALATYGLLVLRASGVSGDDMARFAGVFGTLLPTGTGGQLEQYVSNVRPDGTLGSAEVVWHSDTSFAPEPYRVLCLYAVDVVPGESSTRFISAVNVARALPAELRTAVAHRQAVHVADMPNGVRRGRRLQELGPSIPACAHPILKRHPVTDAEIVYVNEFATDAVFGVSTDRSDELLGQLFARLYTSEGVFEHFWRNGDLVVWDNLALQHSRGDVSNVGNRTLQKFTVGPVTLAEQFPDLLSAIAQPYQTAPA